MVTPRVQVIATDLDHTLLNASGGVSPVNQAAIRRATAAGWTVVVATGRRLDSVRTLLQELGLNAYQVCLNGAFVASPDGQVLAKRPFAIDTVFSLFDLMTASGVNLMLNTAKKTLCYPGRDDVDVPEFITRTANNAVIHSRTELAAVVQSEPIYKVAYNGQDRVVLQQLVARVRQAQLATPVWADTTYVEMNAPEISKRSGLAVVAAQLGIGLEQFVACGDYENDMTMLQGAGLGVAMSNALPQVQAVADRVVDNTDGNGVGRILNELLDQQEG